MTIGQAPFVVETRVTVILLAQLSMAVTAAGGGTSLEHWKVRFVGMPTNVGGMVSRTVIVRVAVVAFVQLSVAVQVQVITNGQTPLVVHTIVTVTLLSQLSAAVTADSGGTSRRH
jgi:hypothetical protein